jgi:hypothetical protein
MNNGVVSALIVFTAAAVNGQVLAQVPASPDQPTSVPSASPPDTTSPAQPAKPLSPSLSARPDGTDSGTATATPDKSAAKSKKKQKKQSHSNTTQSIITSTLQTRPAE